MVSSGSTLGSGPSGTELGAGVMFMSLDVFMFCAGAVRMPLSSPELLPAVTQEVSNTSRGSM